MDVSTITTLFPALAPYAAYLAGAVAVSAALSTRLPAPVANESKAYAYLYKAVNFIAMNFGQAKNAVTSK